MSDDSGYYMPCRAALGKPIDETPASPNYEETEDG